MKHAAQYPITTKYGWVKGYPLNTSPYSPMVPAGERKNYPGKGYGFHTGEDRAMPIGTPIIVNQKKIGLSGNSGASTGPHLHITRRRYLTNQLTSPNGGGFVMKPGILGRAKVLYGGDDPYNGHYLVIRSGNGAKFWFCHLSKITCKAGERL